MPSPILTVSFGSTLVCLQCFAFQKIFFYCVTNSGEVSEVDVWGMRKLAYPIEKKEEGYYVVMEFKAGTDVPKELDRRLKISDAIIRHQIINKDAK